MTGDGGLLGSRLLIAPMFTGVSDMDCGETISRVRWIGFTLTTVGSTSLGTDAIVCFRGSSTELRWSIVLGSETKFTATESSARGFICSSISDSTRSKARFRDREIRKELRVNPVFLVFGRLKSQVSRCISLSCK